MNKRNVATVLWFLMGWTIGSALAIVAGLPTLVGVLLGIPFGAFVRWEPTGHLWAGTALPTHRNESTDSSTRTTVSVS